MTFPHFQHPEKYAAFHPAPTPCSICGNETKCFDARIFYGETEIDAICSDCLRSGQLKTLGITTCTGDIETLKEQLRELNPHWSEPEIEQSALLKTEILETQTPKIISWQDWDFPCAEGDYCTFVCYAAQADYNEIAPDGDGQALLINTLYGDLKDNTDEQDLWDDMPKRKMQDYAGSQEVSTLVYLFKSLHSDAVVTVWDGN